MRAMTHMIYVSIFRIQALIGFSLAVWLIATALMQGQYAGVSLIIGVFAGVIALASLWPFLTPSWLEKPSYRKHLVPLMAAHLILPVLYCFVAVSAFLAAELAEPIGRQLMSVAIVVILSAATICWFAGARLCFVGSGRESTAEGGTVTELVLPTSRDAAVVETVPERMSRAS